MTTVLVVDDEPVIRESLAAVLMDEGFAVQTAEDGLEALILQTQRPADLILCDVNMPLVDGDERLAELRERGDRTPVVLMSAAQVPECNLPNIRSLQKPFDLDAVLDLITGMFAITPAGPPLDTKHDVPTAEVAPRPRLTLPAMSALGRVESLRAQAEGCYAQLTRSLAAADSARALLRKCHERSPALGLPS